MVCHREGKFSQGQSFLKIHCSLDIHRWEGPLIQTRRETSVGSKGKENSYYILWSAKTNLLEAEKLVCVVCKARLMGRQRQLRGTRKTSLTQHMPQREVSEKVPRAKTE